MLEWMLMPLRRYAQFTGRSRRKEFWSFALLNAIVMVVVIALAIATGSSAALSEADPANPLGVYTALFSGIGILLGLWFLATLVPNIAVTVRRLHDRDMSGWWYLGFLVASFIPFVNIVASIALLVLMLLPGTAGPNKYGPDPKDPASVEVFA